MIKTVFGLMGLSQGADTPGYLSNPSNYKTEWLNFGQNQTPTYQERIGLTDKGSDQQGNIQWPGTSHGKNSVGAAKQLAYTQGDKYVGVYWTEWGHWKHFPNAGEQYGDLPTTPWRDEVNQQLSDRLIPAKSVSHILFGFVPICADDETWEQFALCTVNLCDASSPYPSPLQNLLILCNYEGSEFSLPVFDSIPDSGENFPAFEYIANNSDVKPIASIGGWTLSRMFYHMDTDEKIDKFTNEVVKYLVTFPFFQGVDIDYENPGGSGADDGATEFLYAPVDRAGMFTGEAKITQVPVKEGNKEVDGANYLKLVKALRQKLDTLGQNWNTPRTYELTIAINCDLDKIALVPYGDMHPYLDAINMMTYDFSGAWTKGGDDKYSWITNQTNLYPRPDGINMVSVDDAVKALTGLGVPANKLSVGVAMYGRGWSNVTGGATEVSFFDDEGNEATAHDYFDGNTTSIDAPNMLGCSGVVQPGVIDWSALSMAHKDPVCEYYYDECAEAPQLACEDAARLIGKELYTYDNPRSVFAKGKYVVDNGLRGLFAWAYDQDNGEILNAMNESVGNKPIGATAMFAKADGSYPFHTVDRSTCTGEPTTPPAPTDPVVPNMDDAFKVYVDQCGIAKETTATINCSTTTPASFSPNSDWINDCQRLFPVLIATPAGDWPTDCATAVTNFKSNHPNGCDCGMSS